ncbi:hypothetical protein B5K11_33500 [Rhizobium leguminosarum bv. trifolii]|nr:hypothetical protein B5K11_33500 [Rhizobium leguminosarum bv. trifolii]
MKPRNSDGEAIGRDWPVAVRPGYAAQTFVVSPAHLVNWSRRTYHVTPAKLRRSHRELGVR